MPRTRTITEIPFERIEKRFQLASYWFGAKWCPAVDRKGDSYRIRILAGEKRSRNFSVTTTYEYFELDPTGLILASPRGFAPEYNKRVRVSDIAAALARFTEPDCTATKLRLGV